MQFLQQRFQSAKYNAVERVGICITVLCHLDYNVMYAVSKLLQSVSYIDHVDPQFRCSYIHSPAACVYKYLQVYIKGENKSLVYSKYIVPSHPYAAALVVDHNPTAHTDTHTQQYVICIMFSCPDKRSQAYI